jgi:hypothetical protein
MTPKGLRMGLPQVQGASDHFFNVNATSIVTMTGMCFRAFSIVRLLLVRFNISTKSHARSSMGRIIAQRVRTRKIAWSLVCTLFLSAVVRAQASSWEAVKALSADTSLAITQQTARRIRGHLQAADDTKLTIRVHGDSVAVPRSSIAEIDRVISRRYFNRKGGLIGFVIGAGFAELASRTWGSEARNVTLGAVEFGLIGMTIGTWKSLTRKDDRMVVYSNPQP